jgi:predicted GNAT family acetyltransferase
MSSEIQHFPRQNRYVLVRDGEQVGLTDYRMHGDVMHITHTEIDPQLRGDELGSEMVEGVLDRVRSETGYRVVAECPFVADWLERHPEYDELVTRGR